MILPVVSISPSIFFFFNDTATTEIYTLSLHDALPISGEASRRVRPQCARFYRDGARAIDESRDHAAAFPPYRDRKSTRLNSSHLVISYAVFCLKKKTFETTLAYSTYPVTNLSYVVHEP